MIIMHKKILTISLALAMSISPGGKRVCRQGRRFKTGTGLDGRAA